METHWIENKSDNFSHSFAVHRHTNAIKCVRRSHIEHWPMSTWSSSALSSKCVLRTQMCVPERRSSPFVASECLCKIKCGKFASHRKNRKTKCFSLFLYFYIFVFSLLLCGNGNNKIIMRRWTSTRGVAVTRRNRLAFAHFLFIPCMHFLFGQRQFALGLCEPHHFLHHSNSNALSPVKVGIVCCDKTVHGECSGLTHHQFRVEKNEQNNNEVNEKEIRSWVSYSNLWHAHQNRRQQWVHRTTNCVMQTSVQILYRWSMLSFRLNTFLHVRRTSDTSTSFSSCFVTSLSVVATFIVVLLLCVSFFICSTRALYTVYWHAPLTQWLRKKQNSKWEWVENRETKQSVCKWGTIQRNSL